MRLLSPAGSPESLLAALKRGADGVYFGGAAFNARRGAANFSDAEMEKALDLCHLYGAKAFITMNTLLTDRELPEAMAYARFLYRAVGQIQQFTWFAGFCSPQRDASPARSAWAFPLAR